MNFLKAQKMRGRWVVKREDFIRFLNQLPLNF
ncbi:hypothetical protein HNQ64_004785 [Prosthecobacter dejongeii]|uniref:Uncharacterized protein n=1 Tax=Prosthecobacter dejongeii TaxID=48465 RepID=A0A7W7YQS3_9BACT|nr:hypothetical protein [Prosthecobacter dejongeii]